MMENLQRHFKLLVRGPEMFHLFTRKSKVNNKKPPYSLQQSASVPQVSDSAVNMCFLPTLFNGDLSCCQLSLTRSVHFCRFCYYHRRISVSQIIKTHFICCCLPVSGEHEAVACLCQNHIQHSSTLGRCLCPITYF